MIHIPQCCNILYGGFGYDVSSFSMLQVFTWKVFYCVCILNVASFSMDIFGYASIPFNVAKFITLATFNHNVNGLAKLQEEILGFFTTQIHYVLMKWDKVH
jgi:hypothetical protein